MEQSYFAWRMENLPGNPHQRPAQMLVNGLFVAEVKWILGHWYSHLWIARGWVAKTHEDRNAAIAFVEAWAKNKELCPRRVLVVISINDIQR